MSPRGAGASSRPSRYRRQSPAARKRERCFFRHCFLRSASLTIQHTGLARRLGCSVCDFNNISGAVQSFVHGGEGVGPQNERSRRRRRGKLRATLAGEHPAQERRSRGEAGATRQVLQRAALADAARAPSGHR